MCHWYLRYGLINVLLKKNTDSKDLVSIYCYSIVIVSGSSSTMKLPYSVIRSLTLLPIKDEGADRCG